MTLSDRLINDLKALAVSDCWADALNTEDSDVIVDDFAGGNVDDAYYGGERSGEVLLARRILDKLGIQYK